MTDATQIKEGRATPRTDEIAAKLYDMGVTGDAAALALLDHARKIERALSEAQSRLRDEEERHALLQARCFEGFPSASDGIFDALRESDAYAERLLAGVQAIFPLIDTADDALDKDTYDEKLRHDFDLPDDFELSVRADTGRKIEAVFRAMYKLRAALAKNPNPAGQSSPVPSLEDAGAVGLGPQEAEADSADFEAGTWTFRMAPGFRVAAGRFLITPLRQTPLEIREIPDKGPWTAQIDHPQDRSPGWEVYSEDFTHDVTLTIHGDFASDDEKRAYAKWLAATLNTHARWRAALQRGDVISPSQDHVCAACDGDGEVTLFTGDAPCPECKGGK